MTHRLVLPGGFILDYQNVMQDKIGPAGLRLDQLTGCPGLAGAFNALQRLHTEGRVEGHSEPVLFTRLPWQPVEQTGRLHAMEAWGHQVRQQFGTLVSMGIGGSYLGNQVLADALLGPDWNLARSGRSVPRVFFSGNNVDPASIRQLRDAIDPGDTMFLVISKSGTTMETMAAFVYFYNEVKALGLDPASHFTAVTDPEKGILRDIALQEGFPVFQVPPGIGGRWSVLSDAGLLLAAATGLPVRQLLEGGRDMVQACLGTAPLQNPAALYACICHQLHREHGIDESVIMPYAGYLRSLAGWYVQLLAESLGKEKDRQGRIVNAGRTPIPALGTTDMHAQTQQHREGKRNKLVTTIAVQDFAGQDIILDVPSRWRPAMPYLQDRPLSKLLHAARQANEESLAADGRPNCCISIPRLDAYQLGQLFLFFELATAFEGELLDVNAFDQPGVEHYKKLMKTML